MSEVPTSPIAVQPIPKSVELHKNEIPIVQKIPEPLHTIEKPSFPLPDNLFNKSPLESINPIEIPMSKPIYNSTFTKDISDSMNRCKIQVDYVNPTPIGEGANHLVYSYLIPNEQPHVIKIAKEQSTTSLTDGGAQGELEAIMIAKRTFGPFAAQTDVMTDPNNDERFFVIQEAVKGKHITNTRFKNNLSIRKQLGEIVKLNNGLYGQGKICLDFMGMAGFTGWFKSQFKNFFLRKSEFEVTNIIEDENGKLKIIDFEYFNLNKHVGIKKRIINFVGMTANRILMKHYFGLDIKKG